MVAKKAENTQDETAGDYQLTGSGSVDARMQNEREMSLTGFVGNGAPVSFRLAKLQGSNMPSQKERSAYSGQRWGGNATNTLSKKSATIKEGHTHGRSCDHLRMERLYKLLQAMGKADNVSKVLMIVIE